MIQSDIQTVYVWLRSTALVSGVKTLSTKNLPMADFFPVPT